MEPAIRLDGLAGGLGLVVIAFHDVRAARQDLSVGGDLHLYSVDRLPDGADTEIRGRVDGNHGRSLGEAVSLENLEPSRVEELVDLR